VNVLALDISAKKPHPAPRIQRFMRPGGSGVESTERRIAPRWTNPPWDQERVELVFATVELRSICENRRRATAVIGADAARELSQRLADLMALATVADVADVFPADIIDRSPTERALRLKAGHDLIFCAGHVQVPIDEGGGTDWTRVSRIRITALETCNG
jgi:hypothetical protein